MLSKLLDQIKGDFSKNTELAYELSKDNKKIKKRPKSAIFASKTSRNYNINKHKNNQNQNHINNHSINNLEIYINNNNINHNNIYNNNNNNNSNSNKNSKKINFNFPEISKKNNKNDYFSNDININTNFISNSNMNTKINMNMNNDDNNIYNNFDINKYKFSYQDFLEIKDKETNDKFYNGVKINEEKLINNYRLSLNKELLRRLFEEREKENIRENILKSTKNIDERKNLEKRYIHERAIASSEIILINE